MDLIPKPDQVVSAAGNVAHTLLYGGLADLRPMPRTLIDDGELREVYHYRPAAGVAPDGDPILLVTPLAAPALCFDLRRGCSLVEHLVTEGRPTYLLEYGQVSFRNRSLGMEHWVDEVLPQAIETVSQHAGGRPVHVVGWSLGGIFALLSAADRADLPVASLSVMGSPVDVKKVPLVAPVRPLLNLTQGRGAITRAYQALGGIPVPLVNWAFTAASAQKVLTKPLAILTHLDDTDFLAQLEAVDRFTDNMTAYPGRTFGQLYHRFVRGNALAGGSMRMGDRTVDLAAITVPVLVFAGATDGIAPDGLGETAGGPAHRFGGGPVRDRARRAPRHAHRPRGPRDDVARARRVGEPVVGSRGDRPDAGEEEARHEGCRRSEEEAREEAARRRRAADEGPREEGVLGRDRDQPDAALHLRRLEIPRPAMSTLGRGVRIGYGSGSVATGAFGTVPGLMLLPYLTDELGIAALWAGMIVFVPKAWDVVLNPIAGRISDRTVDPAGPRRPWLIRAGLMLAGAFALIFAAPDMGSRWLEAGWVLVFFVLAASAYAFFQVPYVAMPAEITSSYDERTRLMTWRVAILAFTIMLAGATAPVIRDAVGGRDGYRVMGVVMAVLIVVGVVSAWWGTRNAPIGAVAAGAGSLREQLRVVARARDFRVLLTTFILQALATGCMLAGVDYLAGDVLDRPGAATILFVCFVGPALLLTPVWTAVGTRIGKRQGYVIASLVLAAGALLAVSARVAPPAVVFAATALVGVGYAGCQVFPMAMLPDAAAVDTARTGENRAGVYTGVWTAGETLGLASGPAVFAVVLALGGYLSSQGREIAQPDSALNAITIGFSVVPAVLTLVSLWWLRQYTLDAAEVAATEGALHG